MTNISIKLYEGMPVEDLQYRDDYCSIERIKEDKNIYAEHSFLVFNSRGFYTTHKTDGTYYSRDYADDGWTFTSDYKTNPNKDIILKGTQNESE